MWEQILHILIHAIKDTAVILPILFLVYVLIEVIENKCARGWKKSSLLKGKYSPLLAGGVGIIPQCGFSVIATDLYAEKKIQVGTLIAVYLATSDEALPILLGYSYTADTWKYIILLIAIKFVYAVLIGYLINFVVNQFSKRRLAKVATNNIEIHDEEEHHEHEHDYGCCGHDVSEGETTFKKFIMHPLLHSLKICLYIFIINLIFGAIIEFVGLEYVQQYMLNDTILQPFIVGLVGLIPNCASSVIITKLFIEVGGISFASCIAGLCVNAGVALLVLFKNNKNIKVNLAILATLYLSSTILGFALQFII